MKNQKIHEEILFINNMIKKIILENEKNKFAYGSEIRNLEKDLASDEEINLTDYSGPLRGDVVKKKDYVVHMLNDAIDKKDWGKVEYAILYLKHKM